MSEPTADKLVKGHTLPKAGNHVVYDEEISGFGVRITVRGARAFVLNDGAIEGRDRPAPRG